MTTYKYLGYGVTDENGVAHLDHDANGDPLTHSYTGVGAGEVDVLASLDKPITDGSIVSGTYPVLDTIVYEAEDVTASKNYNITLDDTDFYLEFTVCPPANISQAYVVIGDSTNNLQIGDLYGNANCGVNWAGGTFYGKAISMETDTKVSVSRTGTSMVLTVGDSTYNITGMNITCTTLKNITIGNSGVVKGFKIYPI